MLGAPNVHTAKAKQIIIVIAIIILWQFTFPQPVSAALAAPISKSFPLETEIEQEITEPLRLLIIADKPAPEAKRTMQVPVTAYSSTPDQTHGDPFITASGSRVRDGIIAANFRPIGTKVRFPDYYGNKVFVVEDRMNARYWQRADIWMETRDEAKQWGIRYTTIEIL